jgi:ABC-type spermidine/putrescine transport system permease subunit II
LRIPRSLVEMAVAEGRHPFGIWRRAIAPLTARAYLIVAIATSALAFGEVSAGKLAQPPARGVSVLRLFDQMHYGAESTVAGFCLLQLAATWGILWVLVGLNRNGLRESSR